MGMSSIVNFINQTGHVAMSTDFLVRAPRLGRIVYRRLAGV